MSKKTKWEETAVGNFILETKDFYISFLGDVRQSPKAPGMSTFTLIGSMLGIETSDCETALCLRNAEPKWRILNGDFRAEYEQVFPSLKKCVAVYEKHKQACRSDWSTDEVGDAKAVGA